MILKELFAMSEAKKDSDTEEIDGKRYFKLKDGDQFDFDTIKQILNSKLKKYLRGQEKFDFFQHFPRTGRPIINRENLTAMLSYTGAMTLAQVFKHGKNLSVSISDKGYNFKDVPYVDGEKTGEEAAEILIGFMENEFADRVEDPIKKMIDPNNPESAALAKKLADLKKKK